MVAWKLKDSIIMYVILSYGHTDTGCKLRSVYSGG